MEFGQVAKKLRTTFSGIMESKSAAPAAAAPEAIRSPSDVERSRCRRSWTRRCSSQASLEASDAFTFLADELSTTILVPSVAQHLDCADSAALRMASRSIDACTRRGGRPAFAHVTDRAADLPPCHIDHEAVESMSTAVDAEDFCVVPASFSNCRTVRWQAPATMASSSRGDYVESGCISIAGINDLYFRLYPQGKGRSSPGFCALYVGSSGTARDVALRLSIDGSSRVLVQRLQNGFVDGFVNFCDLSSVDLTDVVVTLEVMRSPNDRPSEGRRSMHIASAPLWVNWSVPAGALDCATGTGDRLTSETFCVDGLGDDASFVVYPYGDTVDELSKVGSHVNVGLFGSADRDVTFRLTAGSASKVLTAGIDRYRSRMTGTVKAAGEFFDPCFAPLDDMREEDGSLKLQLEVLDTQARHYLRSQRDGVVSWRLENLSGLRAGLREGEELTTRYLRMVGLDDGFLSLSVAFHYRAVEVGIHKVSTGELSRDEFHVALKAGGVEEAAEVLDCRWKGQKDHFSTRFELPAGRLPEDLEISIARFGAIFCDSATA